MTEDLVRREARLACVLASIKGEPIHAVDVRHVNRGAMVVTLSRTPTDAEYEALGALYIVHGASEGTLLYLHE